MTRSATWTIVLFWCSCLPAPASAQVPFTSPSETQAMPTLAQSLATIPLDTHVSTLAQTSASAQGSTATPLDAQATRNSQDGVDIKGVLVDSTKLLMLEHLARITFQQKTRRELGGPFFRDYADSVHIPRSWGDGDGWFVNDVGHPVQGAAAGYIWLDHEPPGSSGTGFGRRYWASRGRAAAWAAVYSLEFEVGPFSEASIGNVGKRRETTGWTDYLVTPVGGLAMIVLEDVLDRSFLRKIEMRTTNRALRATLRTVVTPGRSLSNIASSRAPWYRDSRPLDWRR